MFWTEVPRDVVQVAGPDAATFLHSQLSQDIRPLSVGGSAWSFLLQPNGKIDVLARVWRTTGDEFVLDTDAGFGEAMVARLNRFKIRVKAQISTLPWRCLAVRGEGGDEVAAAAPQLGGVVGWGGEVGGFDLLGVAPVAPPTVRQGTPDELLAERISAVWPAMGAEIVPGETIPSETGVIPVAVNFTKGCYPGQELVERMDSRGAIPPRLLQRVVVESGTVAGDSYLRNGESVGVVTSVLGEAALAMVKRSALSG